METDEQSVSDEQYLQYETQRMELASLARREIVSQHFPGRPLESLRKEEWNSISDDINKRFRELLITAFPDRHYELNKMYLNKKLADKQKQISVDIHFRNFDFCKKV